MSKIISIRVDDGMDQEAMADLLIHIANLVGEGFTSGYYPHWEITSHEG